MGSTTNTACILTLVERKSGFVAIGQLSSRYAPEVNARLRQLLEAQPQLKKRVSMAHVTQRDCQRVADKLNRRPRQRLGSKTPEEVYAA